MLLGRRKSAAGRSVRAALRTTGLPPEETRAPEPGPGRSWSAGDARLTIALVQETISTADGKASILGAAGTVLLGFAATTIDISVLLGGSVGQRAGLVVGALALGAFAMFSMRLGGVLVPRVDAEQESRYAWPSLVTWEVDDLVARRDGDQVDRREAWTQAQMLARISQRKHQRLKSAMRWFGCSSVLLVAWLFLWTVIS